MGVVVNTNAASIAASRILDANRHSLQSTMEKLSSGKRINSAADDAAGMAVAAKLRADVHSLNQSVRNANDAVSLVNTYDGASSEVESMLVRMRELAVQATNGTYSTSDTALASNEFTQLQTEIDRISANTTFNRKNIANASVASGQFSFRVGPQQGTADDVTVNLNSISSSALGVASAVAAITTVGSATTAVSAIDTAISNLASNRAVAGAFVNRLGHTIANLQNVSQRTQEALSGVEDADYAAESAALARGMVLAQAGTAMLAQANQSPQYILTLLRG
jgi:flagellin